MSRRPLIGVTTYLEPARWGAWDESVALVPAAYVESVEREGGRALLVPPSEEGIEETLDALDGLVFTGGADLDPALYGEQPHPETAGVQPARDRAELALLQAALARDLPVLAICRGSQLLNIARGGTLLQHLPDELGHELHREVRGVYSDHEVAVDAGSRLAGLLGPSAPVKSHHHQGIARVGEGLRAVAHAEDGTLEALEDPSRRFALGVLWHPEAGQDKALFRALVAEASRYQEARNR